MDILSIQQQAEKEIKGANDLKELNLVFEKYLGRKGEISKFFRSLKDLPLEQRKIQGKKANQVKEVLEKKIQEKRTILSKKPFQEIKRAELDVTQPGERINLGHLSILTYAKREVIDFFKSIGFEIIESPEVETEYYNFDALNIPDYHPARDSMDTFWLKNKEKSKDKFLLRTHTSPSQIRYMEKHKPPFRVITPGRVFRYEAIDASHEAQFYQVEGLAVSKDIGLANLRYVLENFLKYFFGREVNLRWRPGYFPFVEPGLEVDIECQVCQGKGCPTCKYAGFIELAGAGMVHPNVLKNGGINPYKWQGFAFGLGLDRLVMMRHNINDIRLFHSGDLRFMSQF
ncbi:phenylalanine--tRNA ligase subunit alpha [bacterium]|nr:phenylalanine--tRNA ligase subunit alpha [bacterium]